MSLSNTCVGRSDIRAITKSVCQCPDRSQQHGELVKDHTIIYTEDKIQISHDIICRYYYYFRVQPPHLKATWTQHNMEECVSLITPYVQWIYAHIVKRAWILNRHNQIWTSSSVKIGIEHYWVKDWPISHVCLFIQSTLTGVNTDSRELSSRLLSLSYLLTLQ